MGTLSRSEVTTCCVARGEEQGQLPLGHPGPHVSWALCLPPGRGEGQTHTHVAPCPPLPRFRVLCQTVIAHKLFDYVVLAFIFLNCITIALERPQIEAGSTVSGCSLQAGQGTRQRGRPPGPAMGQCARAKSSARPNTMEGGVAGSLPLGWGTPPWTVKWPPLLDG